MILPLDAYGGTFRLVESVHKGAGSNTPRADIEPVIALDAACVTKPDWWWRHRATPRCRSSTSRRPPTMSIAGRQPLVDNNLCHPLPAEPSALGADVVVHSTTKYLGGTPTPWGAGGADCADVADASAFLQNATGAVPGPWDSYLSSGA